MCTEHAYNIAQSALQTRCRYKLTLFCVCVRIKWMSYASPSDSSAALLHICEPRIKSPSTWVRVTEWVTIANGWPPDVLKILSIVSATTRYFILSNRIFQDNSNSWRIFSYSDFQQRISHRFYMCETCFVLILVCRIPGTQPQIPQKLIPVI